MLDPHPDCRGGRDFDARSSRGIAVIMSDQPRRLALTAALSLALGAAGWVKADIVFAADGQNGNPATSLYTLDPLTGAKLSTVGPIGFAVASLAFNPLTGVLYGDTPAHGSSTRQLITINPNTGAGMLIGPLGVAVDGLAFDHDGTLFGWSGRVSGSSLYKINVTTGAATKVGTAGITDIGAALAIDAVGTMFLAAAGASGALRTVDKPTGTVSTVSTLTGAPIPSGAIKSLAFSTVGTLYGVNLAEGGPGKAGAPGNTFLVTINPSTGAVTSLGPSLPGLDAIAIQLSVVPEPSVLTLSVGAGAFAFCACWQRQRGRSDRHCR
jgi:hypothetical protein